jgi:hypothetical protein
MSIKLEALFAQIGLTGRAIEKGHRRPDPDGALHAHGYEPTREAAMAACPLPPETVYDRAMRRARKLCLRLGGDPTDDE